MVMVGPGDGWGLICWGNGGHVKLLSRENYGIHACIPFSSHTVHEVLKELLSLGVEGRGVRMMPFSFEPFLEFLWDPGIIDPCILISKIVVQM